MIFTVLDIFCLILAALEHYWKHIKKRYVSTVQHKIMSNLYDHIFILIICEVKDLFCCEIFG